MFDLAAESNAGFYAGEPGYYLNVPDQDYHKKKDAASNSLCKHGVRSATRLWAAIQEEVSPQTTAQRFGVAYHYALLEPDVFDERVMEAPECCDIKGSGDKCTNTAVVFSGPDPYCGVHAKKLKGELVGLHDDPDALIITPKEYEDLRGMQDAMFAHPEASILLEGDFHEGVILWERTHVLSDGREVVVKKKGKIDHWNEEYVAIVDPKSTKDSSDAAFSKAIFEYWYFTQGPVYIEGLRAQGVEANDFIMLAQDKTFPFEVNPVMLDDETMRLGQRVHDLLIERYVRCLEGERGSYKKGISPIGIPFWAKKQIEESLF